MIAILLPLLLAIGIAELPARRLSRPEPGLPGPAAERPGSVGAVVLPTLVAAAVARFLLPGLLGWLAAVAAATALAVRSARAERRSRQSNPVWIAAAHDLLCACLAAGADPLTALRVTVESSPAMVALPLRPVVAAMELGADPRTAWKPLSADPAWRSLARAFVRSAETGAPLATLLAQSSAGLRADQHARRREAARRAGVHAVLPVGLCFLPAFVLVGIVPLVVGLVRPMLG